MPTFTVLTPTYNRAHTLHRVYDSLKVQTFRDFEWIIVDDGSSDGTDNLVQHWQTESAFPIDYVWQENRGKHIAVNRGVEMAQGLYLLIFDSDDTCMPFALERYLYHLVQLPEGFSGVASLMQYADDGSLVGNNFPLDPTDSTLLEIRTKYKVKGDKWVIQTTQVMREFPFPDLPNQRFMSESLVWFRIAQKYKCRFVNEVLGVCYRQEGMTNLSHPRHRVHNSAAAVYFYREYTMLPLPLQVKLRGYANYIRFSLHAKYRLSKQLQDISNSLFWIAVFPVGFALYLSDCHRMKKLLDKGI